MAEVSTSNGNKNMKILQVEPIPYEGNYEGENNEDANINPNNIKTLLEDKEVENNQSFIPNIDNIGGSNGKIDSGTVFSLFSKPSWIYIPINYTYDRDIQKFKRLLNKIIKSDTDYKEKSINSLSISKLCDFIINNRTKINNAYNSIFPNTNASSLCVYSCMLPSTLLRKSYSYYVHPNLVNRCCDPWFHIDKRIMNIEGCLYTGDSAMNSGIHLSKTLFVLASIRKWIDRLGTLQLPHHGSKYNFGKVAMNMLMNVRSTDRKIPLACFAGFGSHNPYSHPSDGLISELMTYNILYAGITEDKNTTMYQIIEVFE